MWYGQGVTKSPKESLVSPAKKEPVDGYCSECKAPLIADLCPTPGCFGLPLSVLSYSDRELVSAAETEEAARSLVPQLNGHKKKLDYLGYRYSGRTMLDSLVRVGIEKKQLMEWRTVDPKFRQVESELSGPNRHAIRKEIQSLIFLRTFHTFQMKDAEVLERDMNLADGEQLSSYDQKYLMEVRKNYTPQTLEAIQRLMSSGVTERDDEVEEWQIRVRRYIGRGGALVPVGEIVDE